MNKSRMFKSWAKLVLTLLYRRKLSTAVSCLKTCSDQDLQNPNKLKEIISRAGLRHDRRGLCGADIVSMNAYGPGLWQLPAQLAACLVELGRHPVRKAMEIGVADGWTSVFLAAYLARFNQDLDYIGLDLNQVIPCPGHLSKMAPVRFVFGKTSDDFRGALFDFCFIDGNHSYEWCKRDYEIVGRHARMCLFHDINDEFVGADHVPKFWNELALLTSSSRE